MIKPLLHPHLNLPLRPLRRFRSFNERIRFQLSFLQEIILCPNIHENMERSMRSVSGMRGRKEM